MPKGYIIGHVIVYDADAYGAYATRNNEILPNFGGQFLARGGASEEVEGDLTGHRHVIIEFPSFAQAQAFYASPEYQDNILIRQANSTGHIVVVEGTPDE